jgi:hypothetical protein
MSSVGRGCATTTILKSARVSSVQQNEVKGFFTEQAVDVRRVWTSLLAAVEGFGEVAPPQTPEQGGVMEIEPGAPFLLRLVCREGEGN